MPRRRSKVAQALQRDNQQLQRRQDHAKKWIAAIRRCHRTQSHAMTSRTIKAALANLESGPVVLSLF